VRVERIGDATLYLANCFDAMPKAPGKADVLVTDPPYGIDGGSGTVGKSRAHKHTYASFEDTPENVKRNVVGAVTEALYVCGGRGVVTPGPKCFMYYPAPDAFGSVFQPATCSLNLWGRASSQPIFYYGRPPRIGKEIGDTTYTVTKADAEGAEDHPCPKPLSLIKQLVLLASDVGETVLDPFMGSGTTGVACAKLERKFIGIEIEPKYFDIACRRIEAAYKQPDLFIGKPPKAKQEAML
jgi:DNA modification methylase